MVGVRMLIARSPDECHLYMELHPCPCGEDVFEWTRHAREQRGDVLVSVYEGRCGGCGTLRRFEFAVPEQYPPPPAYGEDEPSRIIDPSEFLMVGRRLAAAVPADPSEVDPAEREDAYEAMEMAVAALAEVLKFIPPGSGAVPPDAFISDLGREAYRREPEQFSRDRLAEELATYQAIRSAYAGAVGLDVQFG